MKAITDIIRACGKGPGFLAVGFYAVHMIGRVTDALIAAPAEVAADVGGIVQYLFVIVCGAVFGAGLWKRLVDKRANGNGNGVTVLPVIPGEAIHATRESVGG